MRVVLLVVACCAAFSGCVTTTTIVSDPAGASVYGEDGKKELGKTPFKYETKMAIWGRERLTLKADGYKPQSVEVKRSEVDVVPMVAGVCMTLTCCLSPAGIPIILANSMKLPDVTKVTLQRTADAEPLPPTTLRYFAQPPEAVAALEY